MHYKFCEEIRDMTALSHRHNTNASKAYSGHALESVEEGKVKSATGGKLKQTRKRNPNGGSNSK
jgi:hypothetical protein